MARRATLGAMIFLIAVLSINVLEVNPRASALDPPTPPGGFSFTEQPNVPPGSGYNPDIPQGPAPYGGSVWVYSDMTGSQELEGSYKPFDDQLNQLYGSDTIMGTDGKIRTPGPHGVYSTTSNKCSICHAAHRATGSYSLLRVDTASNACDYCHVGDHRHSRLGAYTNSGTIYPSNGHTIGAGPSIPDSTTWQWNTPETSTTEDGTRTINVRSYDSSENRMFRWSLTDLGWGRIGPVTLECITCHQPHNATELIWNPTGGQGLESGYKLLRNSPSGTVNDPDQMRNYSTGTTSDSNPIGTPLIVPEVELSSATTGPGKTSYTRWTGPAVSLTTFSLSVWCADCHNLNIGYKESLGGGFNQWSHSDRTHPVPFGLGVNGTPSIDGQCYSCHVNDMATTGDHGYPTASNYEALSSSSDFPHSGQSGGYKLLGDDLTSIGGPNNLISPSFLDKLCLRCHGDIGVDD